MFAYNQFSPMLSGAQLSSNLNSLTNKVSQNSTTPSLTLSPTSVNNPSHLESTLSAKTHISPSANTAPRLGNPNFAAAAAMLFRNTSAEVAAAARLYPYYMTQGAANPTHGILPGFDYPQAAVAAANLGLFNPYGLIQEEPKPNHSYIGLIAMAILNSPDKKLVLSDIYQYILDNYPYFRSRGPGWRNSIRHNLSLNDCFIKAGRSANGKGHYWAIHPACKDDFAKGDFRRRHAQRKVRRAMGLAVPDEDSDGALSPTPTPTKTSDPLIVSPNCHKAGKRTFDEATAPECLAETHVTDLSPAKSEMQSDLEVTPPLKKSRKRCFDIDSLLLPDCETGPGPGPEKDTLHDEHEPEHDSK